MSSEAVPRIVWNLVLVIWNLFVSCFLYLGIFKIPISTVANRARSRSLRA